MVRGKAGPARVRTPWGGVGVLGTGPGGRPAWHRGVLGEQVPCAAGTACDRDLHVL